MIFLYTFSPVPFTLVLEKNKKKEILSSGDQELFLSSELKSTFTDLKLNRNRFLPLNLINCSANTEMLARISGKIRNKSFNLQKIKIQIAFQFYFYEDRIRGRYTKDYCLLVLWNQTPLDIFKFKLCSDFDI